MRVALSVFLLLHGVAHLVGFLSPWGLAPAPASAAAPPSNVLFGGRLTLSDATARGFGLVWLIVAVAFAVVAVGVWRRAPWSWPALAGVSLISLALSAAWWPTARIGVLINAAILLSLAVATYLAYRSDLRSARARAVAGSTIIETRCGPIEYATLGTGDPILVIHGTGGGWDQGIMTARDIAPHGFQIIAPSRFGYLRTPFPADASPKAEADAHACLLDALKIDRVAVISASAGTAPAIQLALRHPDRVSALILLVPAAGGVYPEIAKGPPQFVMKVLLKFDLPMWIAMKVSPKTLFKLVAVPPQLVPELAPADRAKLDETIDMLLPISGRARGMLNDARSQSGTEALYPLERIAVPTMLVSAEDDLYKTLRVARHAAKTIPDARLIEFKTGGHLLLGHSRQVWPAVASFIRRESTTASVLRPYPDVSQRTPPNAVIVQR
jgi:2-hydroxy-6-oxonona-2,4-dienedioate hydrolase